MGRLFLMYLDGNVYSCKHCKTHLGLAGDIISKTFHCKHGKAYLFHKVWVIYLQYSVSQQMYDSLLFVVPSVNVTPGLKEDRMMMTGMHTVCDVFCVGCGSIVGWKYEAAHEKGQRYKEGKYVLERFKVSGPDGTQYFIAHDAHFTGSDADDV
ncbi:hypothetical protein HU200_014664 [Digitaria exilis]|uniref:Protein yippee-like n=1 Tax=Digitaria exilis TaxID=1010633 RepID=A0A835KK31_9POAL|nr:hypothetical protein HU200_014664 [Digitaria exilis]